MTGEQKAHSDSDSLATLFQVLAKREKAERSKNFSLSAVVFVLAAVGLYYYFESLERRGLPDEFPMHEFQQSLYEKNKSVYDSIDFYLSRLEASENKSHLASLIKKLKSNPAATFEELAPNTISTKALFFNKSVARGLGLGCDSLTLTSTDCKPGELYWPCCLAWSTRSCDTLENKTSYPCKPGSPAYPCCKD